MSTNLYGTIIWQMETFFVNEKREIHTIHRPWLSGGNQWYPNCKLLSTFLIKNYLSINLFDIHVRLYRLVKIWMVKFGEFLVGRPFLLNFSDANVSLHTLHHSLIHVNDYKGIALWQSTLFAFAWNASISVIELICHSLYNSLTLS